jgi:putative dimethyl sulfoxide reductase chaperone
LSYKAVAFLAAGGWSGLGIMNPIIEALRILSHFWLEEIRPDDIATIAALPELAETLPRTDTVALTDLAVEYQRLFGFNLPPYESVFIDPSIMLLAPATARVQALYRQAGWTAPAKVRVGAPDHLGLEMLALAEIKAKAEAKAKEEWIELAQRLHFQHLALWVPAFILTLRRLNPHPFYTALGNLTLDLLLATLPPNLEPTKSQGEASHWPAEAKASYGQFTIDPFPTLPPPPVYNNEGQLIPLDERKQEIGSLRDMVKRLLPPCETGLFLTREDIARMSRALDLPAVMGERPYMLETLLQLAGQYELVPALLNHLRQLLIEADATYRSWASEYPRWTSYAQAWCRRVAATQVLLSELGSTARNLSL